MRACDFERKVLSAQIRLEDVMTESALREALARGVLRANLRGTGPHILRHTFCSHLAMRGAPVKAIQELAGHRDLATTLRYMHLSPAAKQRDSAARSAKLWRHCGDGRARDLKTEWREAVRK